MGGGNSDGIYAVIPWNWNGQPPYDTPVRWHTEDPETDPWEWRIRVLNERDDIAYAKLFFKKSGYITKDWYPYFLAARRGNEVFEEVYQGGTISYTAKRIYDVIFNANKLPVPLIKQLAGFTKEDKSGFDRALTELQMRMFITACGSDSQFSQWAATVFCTTEHFFGEDVFEKAEGITSEDAREKIASQILKLNASASEKKISKFIFG